MTTTSDVLTGARTMWELVDRRAELSPDHPLLIAADGETVTSGQFRDRVERVAAGLHDIGIRTGSVVSWQLPTRIDTVVLSIALARLGAVQNPIIHLYREREVGFACARRAPSCSSSRPPGAAPTSWPSRRARWRAPTPGRPS